jgi:hypothetical protein
MNDQLAFGGMPESSEPVSAPAPIRLTRSVVIDEWGESLWTAIRVRAWLVSKWEGYVGKVEEVDFGRRRHSIRQSIRLTPDGLRRLAAACVKLADWLDEKERTRRGEGEPDE